MSKEKAKLEVIMSKEKEKVGDFEENVKTLQGAVKENVELGLETYLTLVEQGQKFANAQIDEFIALEDGYLKKIEESYGEVFKNIPGAVNVPLNFDKIVDAQKSYVKFVRSTSDQLTKNTVNLVQKATENVLSTLEGFYKNIGVA